MEPGIIHHYINELNKMEFVIYDPRDYTRIEFMWIVGTADDIDQRLLLKYCKNVVNFHAHWKYGDKVIKERLEEIIADCEVNLSCNFINEHEKKEE